MQNIYIAGHRGMVGGALVRAFENEPSTNLLLRTRDELDLLNQAQTLSFFKEHTPDVAIIAAAKVGGIHANNTQRAQFLHENLLIAANTIHAAHAAGVQRLLFLGSSCIYPKHAPQPMPESCLLSGPLEPTNEPYAIAKIAGLKLCESYRQQYGALYHSAMPTNLYGPGDNYNLTGSHVLPALLRKMHEAKESGAPTVTVWGSGTPKREFLHVDDLAAACKHLLNLENPPNWVNVGCGEDISIKELAQLIQEIVGFKGELVWDSSKPDGTPRKLMDVSKIKETGWQPTIHLRQGIESTYQAFLNGDGRGR